MARVASVLRQGAIHQISSYQLTACNPSQSAAGLDHAATHSTRLTDLILVLACSIVIYLTLQS